MYNYIDNKIFAFRLQLLPMRFFQVTYSKQNGVGLDILSSNKAKKEQQSGSTYDSSDTETGFASGIGVSPR
ncbi:hypothetical protein BCR42DRAFT_51092 [Absidia repens]|uniref:Uncharacterized protein n=1 Tax=Absidia repens TaxID=90262 RepID=A0A1X2IEZ0_9FUNG|nr:hypothetical protein BCR42DRAFT_51092 [Absidia repens]